MKEIAEENKIYLVGTIPEKEKFSDKLFNTGIISITTTPPPQNKSSMF